MNNIFKITGLGEIRQYTNQKGITSHCRDIQLQQLGANLPTASHRLSLMQRLRKNSKWVRSLQHSSTSTQRSITTRCSRT